MIKIYTHKMASPQWKVINLLYLTLKPFFEFICYLIKDRPKQEFEIGTETKTEVNFLFSAEVKFFFLSG